MYKCPQDKCCLDKCPNDLWHLAKMAPKFGGEYFTKTKETFPKGYKQTPPQK